MKKNRHNPHAAPKPEAMDNSRATLKDLIDPDVLGKLKAQAQAQAQAQKAEEERLKLEKRKQAEEARLAEQKRLDNDFEHLLNNSSQDWKKFK